MNVGDIIQVVAHKELERIDLSGSNILNREMKGEHTLQSFFGTDSGKIVATIWQKYVDDHEPEMEDGMLRYEAQEAGSLGQTGISGYQLHYKGDFLYRAREGDYLLLVKTKRSQYFGLIFQANSGWWRMVKVLFKIRQSRSSFEIISQGELAATKLDFLRTQLLSQLELEVPIPIDSVEQETIIREFVQQYPLL
jgi:hypothetical protein